jgi:superfamily II DNA or RNA helicase
MTFSPRPFQERAIVELSELHRQYAEFLLVMPPGAGKTMTFLYWLFKACDDYPVWILIHEEDLMDQWLDNSRQFVE